MSRFPFLDLIRFGAALLVMFGHLRGFYFESIQKIDSPGIATKLFYFITGAHHEGVILFFVVSGFLVGGKAWRLIERREFNAPLYFIERFSRIYLVLIPALVIVLIIDESGSRLLGDTRLFGMRPLEPSGVTSGWTAPRLACHLVLLQSLTCSPLGADPPLWSLAFEWHFYFIGPLLIGIAYAPMRPALRCIGVTMVLLGLWSLFPSVTTLLPFLGIWFLGALSALILSKRPVSLPFGMCGLVLCALGLIAARGKMIPLPLTDAAVAAGLALSLACPTVITLSVAERWVHRGAGYSYSLYLLHVPVGLLTGAIFERLGYPHELAPPAAPTYFAFATTVLIVMTLSWLFAQLTEDNTVAVRRLISRRPGTPSDGSSWAAASRSSFPQPEELPRV